MYNTESDDEYGKLEGIKPPELYTPDDEELELVSQLSSRYREAQNYRTWKEQEWEINKLYYKGNSIIVRNRTTGDVFRLVQDTNHRLLSSDNVLKRTTRAVVGKLTRAIRTWTIDPASADIEDIEGAKIAEALLAFHRRKEKLDKLYLRWNWSIAKHGTGVVKLDWNPASGKTMLACVQCGYSHYAEGDNEVMPLGVEEVPTEEPCPQCQQEIDMEYEQTVEEMQMQHEAASFGMPEMAQPFMPPEKEQAPTLIKKLEGDVKVDLLKLQDCFPDPAATDIESCRWFDWRRPLPISEIREMFPEKGMYVGAETGIYTENNLTFNSNIYSRHGTTRLLEDHAFLHEFHERPTKKYPKGRIIWMANNIILKEIENPYYKLGRLPFYIFYWEKDEDDFWGDGWIDQARHIQREYDILLTQMREQRELTNKPRVKQPMGSGVTAEELDSTAGRIFQYNAMAGKGPEYMEIPSFATYVYSEVERMPRTMREHASVTEHEAGQSTTDQSGRYAAILDAQAAQQIGPIINFNSTEWIELGRGILILCQEFWDDNRIWTVPGEDMPRTYTFKDLNLKPGWDIDVQEDDALSDNKAVRLTQNFELWDRGIFNNPATGMPDVKTFASKAKIKLPWLSKETTSADRATASSIPKLLEMGQQYEPKPWDDSDIFAEELTAWLKGPGRNADPMLVQQVAQYWQLYSMSSQAGMQAQQGMASSMQGATGGGQASASALPADPSVGAEAEAMVQQADQAGETAARTQTQQES